jgi:hypothetical protein
MELGLYLSIMTKKQFLLLLFCSGTLFRAVEPEFRPRPSEPSVQTIKKAENAFVTVLDTFEAPVGKTQKDVFVTAEIENSELNAVDFTGFFSLHTAKVSDKKNQYFPAEAYTLERNSFNLVSEPVVDLFKDRPFGPGEKRTVVLSFTIPKAVKPTKVYIPTQYGSVQLDLTEEIK